MYSTNGIKPTAISTYYTPEKTINGIIIHKLLARSKFATYAVCKEKNPEIQLVMKHFASKDSGGINSYQREQNAYSKLDHDNILKMIDTLNMDKGDKINAIILEYASKKNLLEYVIKTGAFSENIARSIYKQILNGVEHMHSKELAHFDLKLDNIVLSNDYTIKICDFDSSRPSTQVIKGIKIGTLGYCAPEILNNSSFTGNKADIFSLGVMLFILCVGFPPFNQAVADDPLFKMIKSENFVKFWSVWEEQVGIKVSKEFKDLLNLTWCINGNTRPSIIEMLNSEWIGLEKEDMIEYKKEFEIRYNKIN